MSGSQSKPTNTTSNATSVSTTNNNVSGNSGLTLANTGAGSQALSVNASTNNTTNTTTLSGVSGNTVGAGGSITVQNLDGSVVASALSAATTAFGTSATLAANALTDNSKTSQAAIDQATGLSQAALQIASSAVTSADQTNVNDIDSINDLASGFATQLEGVVTSEQAALQQDQASSQTQLANVTNALTTSFIQGSTSANQTVVNALQSASDNETEVFKYIAIAGAVVALFLLLRE